MGRPELPWLTLLATGPTAGTLILLSALGGGRDNGPGGSMARRFSCYSFPDRRAEGAAEHQYHRTGAALALVGCLLPGVLS